MVASILAVTTTLIIWALLATKLERWRISPPVVVVAAGALVGATTQGSIIGDALNTKVALHTAEIVLAILLFLDATDVKGGLLGRNPAAALRLLLIAMPLSLAAAVVLGMWVLPGYGWAVMLVIACVIVPIDFAPASAILRDRRIPVRVRNILNVESGYNDGIISPLFIFALILAGDLTQSQTPAQALATALPAAAKAIGVGVGTGAVLAFLINRADRAKLMNPQAKRMVLVAAPLLTYALSTGIDGNGFVAAFVCGLVIHRFREPEEHRRELELLEDVGFLLTIVMWFAFGVVAVYILAEVADWRVWLLSAAVLTVIRIGPVLLSLTGSGLTPIENVLIGLLGPRGTTSIVFALLAFNQLPDSAAELALTVMVVTVSASVVLHGVGSLLTARGYQRRSGRAA
ncbi:cation:proton antiporter [Nocardia sp. 2]|uniref:Cation:proton antiporter n=1 Tax=Nocardia acididurans TaxID=2802282 RepID=A0ABS1MG62_9NOCA|nr:cation:proton antiporter [Nocardia acididurans]MBL1079251.1 cation:proton antiporter [Nocardia acididurans]